MFGRNITLFRVFGIDIKIDISWTVIAALIAWSLAQGVFPQLYEGLETTTYWWMAILAVIGLAASIILHELAHSLVAIRYGTPVKSVTLFLLGGVAALENEPRSPRAELLIAIAGPAMSATLAVLFRLLAAASSAEPALAGVLGYLGLLNTVLFIFNMLPAFPMDGGRVLRAVLWGSSGDFKRATRTASQSGKIFGATFMVMGVLFALLGALVGGMLWFLIGMFIRTAAAGAYSSLQVRDALENVTVRGLMTADPESVPPDLPLDRFVAEQLFAHGHDLFPVVEGERVLGSVGLKEVKAVPRTDWPSRRTGEIMTPVRAELVIGPDAPALEALTQMQGQGLSRLLVVQQGRLAGIIALKDLIDLLTIKIALEQPA